MISILETLMAARIAGGASHMQPNRLVVGLGTGNVASALIAHHPHHCHPNILITPHPYRHISSPCVLGLGNAASALIA